MESRYSYQYEQLSGGFMLRQDCLTLDITTASQQCYYLTNSDADLQVNDNLYSSRSGFTLLDFKRSLLLEGNNQLELEFLANELFTTKDLSTASLRLYLTTETAGIYQQQLLFAGNTISITLEQNNKYQVIAAGLLYQLNHLVGIVYSRTCRACLGDKCCQVNLSAYQTEAIITQVHPAENKLSITYSEVDNFAENYWRDGKLVLADGSVFIIASSMGNDLKLAELLDIEKLTPGTPIKIYPGCDHQFSTCQAKFHNTTHFRGEPYVPVSETLVTIVG